MIECPANENNEIGMAGSLARYIKICGMVAILLNVWVAVCLAGDNEPVFATETVYIALDGQMSPEIPASQAAGQSDTSHARLKLFVKKIAGKRISEAEQEEIVKHIIQYSRILGIQPELGAALIAKESRFNPRASSRGYKGLGQLGPGAARNNGVKDPFNIEQNVRGTLSYLKQMMDIWEGKPDRIERALASFNSGAGAVKSRGPGISRKFVNSVLKYHSDIFKLDEELLLSEDPLGESTIAPGE